MGPRNHVLDGGPNPPWEGAILAEGAAIVKYIDLLPWAVQKWLNGLICHLGCGFGWAEGSISSIVFTSWRQCVISGGNISATWRIWLNHPSVAAMQLYVKLLWPLLTRSRQRRCQHLKSNCWKSHCCYMTALRHCWDNFAVLLWSKDSVVL